MRPFHNFMKNPDFSAKSGPNPDQFAQKSPDPDQSPEIRTKVGALRNYRCKASMPPTGTKNCRVAIRDPEILVSNIFQNYACYTCGLYHKYA